MNRVFFLGDIHGSISPLLQLNERLRDKLDRKDTIILLGDAGFNYYLNKKDDRFKKDVCENINARIFVIRGNHEQLPSICAEKYPDDWEYDYLNINDIEGYMYWQPQYPTIFYASDVPDIYYIKDYRTIIFPGAYSVDKYHRLKNRWNWFEHEQMDEAARNLGKALIEDKSHFDFVLSHTCPIHFEPTDLFLSMIDQSTVDKTTERYLQEIENTIGSYNFWLWGHYHTTRIYPAPSERLSNRGQMIMLYNDKALELYDIVRGDYYKFS